MAELFAPMTVVAAGFVREPDAGPRCGGEGSSLEVASRGERDEALIRACLGVDGG